MVPQSISYKGSFVNFYFGASLSKLGDVVSKQKTILLTDDNIFALYPEYFNGWEVIVIPNGEAHKNQDTVNTIIGKLMDMRADRKTWLVGIGGGVVTDITGFVASIYMRGLQFGFVPTTLLGMVDACIGGKNGIDIGVYKNIVGIIKQPNFIFYDTTLLKSLPEEQWSNGFAEIIKHALIKDTSMFSQLERKGIDGYRSNDILLTRLVERNSILKTRVVKKDQFEKGERMMLNFGHTIGHAIENDNNLLHGHAVSIGMIYAAKISKLLINFNGVSRVKNTLEAYKLPVSGSFDKKRALTVLEMDKKRDNNKINYILLAKIGKGVIHPISLQELGQLFLSIKD